MKIAIYSRKSRFTGHGESVENQISMCKNYIYQQFGALPEEDILVFEDEGFSGKNTNRPQFQKLMHFARQHSFDKLVCYRLDRFSRDIRDFTTTLSELEQLHIDFICIREQFDTASPMGRAMMYIASVFAQLERETIAQRIRDNMLELAKTGRWLGGCPPLGYTSQPLHNGAKTFYQLQPVSEETDTVHLIFQLYVQSGSLTKLEQELLLRGIYTRHGNAFSRHSLRFLLSNPVYAPADSQTYAFLQQLGCRMFGDETDYDGTHGLMGYNKTGKTGTVFLHYRDFSEWILAPGLHCPLVSTTLWLSAQRLLLQNKEKAYRRPKNSISLLSGLLTCASCGSYMRPKYGRTDKSGEKRYYYMCELKEKSRRQQCNTANLDGNLLDRQLTEFICTFVQTFSLPPISELLSADCTNFSLPSTVYYQNKLKENKQQILFLSRQLVKIKSTAALQELTRQIDKLDMENKQMSAHLATVSPAPTSFPTDFAALFASAPIAVKRDFLKYIIQRITWDGKNVSIQL